MPEDRLDIEAQSFSEEEMKTEEWKAIHQPWVLRSVFMSDSDATASGKDVKARARLDHSGEKSRNSDPPTPPL